jgi:UDP-GlcNAc:undecaprenyl-phosphate GlcNAc-1-phosphate transferase
LTLLGALDDKFDVSFKLRLAVQAILSLLMIYFGQLHLYQLGNVFALGDITLGTGVSTLFTIFAVIGAINAFNMVDGIDGLLGGLATVSFCSIAFLLKLDNQHGLAYLCAVIAIAMLPYILMNLGLLGRERKVFMGDAGSMLIGFSIVWILFGASQNSTEALMRPVTALWLIAVPLIDMAAIMVRRIRRGDSPFKPDREHLHHIFQRLGFSPRETLLAICLFASLLAGFGIYGELTQIPEYVMFYLFIGLFVVYLTVLSHIWRITSFLRRHKEESKEMYN